MCNRTKISGLSLLAALAALVSLTQLRAKDPEQTKEPAKPVDNVVAKETASPVKAKPLGDSAKRGLAYLVNQQHADGGWGQGGGWRQGDNGGRVEGANVSDPSDVANTCIAMLALLRAGHTPKEGEYAKNVVRGIDFICANIEKADEKTLYVTDIRNTQVQSKIGPFVDTFLASLMLAECKGIMPDEKSEKRMVAALNKTIGKIENNQKADGTFARNEAWASTLSQALCSKGLNRAAQNGFNVNADVLARDQRQALTGFDLKSGSYTAPAPTGGAGGPAPPSDAGVAIYSSSGKTAGLQEAVNTLRKEEKENLRIVNSKDAPIEQKERAKKDLDRQALAEQATQSATEGLVKRLDDKQFIQGFGSNGGEEFLSYMNISETLVVKGGKEWEKWDKQVTDNVNRVQDKDGGWSGHHCITGRTFCTASALLVLLADRAPVPVAAKVKDGK